MLVFTPEAMMGTVRRGNPSANISTTRIKNIKNVRCRDSRSAKSIETR